MTGSSPYVTDDAPLVHVEIGVALRDELEATHANSTSTVSNTSFMQTPFLPGRPSTASLPSYPSRPVPDAFPCKRLFVGSQVASLAADVQCAVRGGNVVVSTARAWPRLWSQSPSEIDVTRSTATDRRERSRSRARSRRRRRHAPCVAVTMLAWQIQMDPATIGSWTTSTGPSRLRGRARRPLPAMHLPDSEAASSRAAGTQTIIRLPRRLVDSPISGGDGSPRSPPWGCCWAAPSSSRSSSSVGAGTPSSRRRRPRPRLGRPRPPGRRLRPVRRPPRRLRQLPARRCGLRFRQARR